MSGPDAKAAVTALEAAAAVLSDAARASREGREAAFEVAKVTDALELTRELLLSRRRSLLDDAARKLRNLYADVRQVQCGATLDHGHMLSEVAQIERLMWFLDRDNGDKAGGRAA